jgi:hypothetical protein
VPLRLVPDPDSDPEDQSNSAGASSWFKALLWAIGPSAPATSVEDVDPPVLLARAAPDGTVEMAISLENHQSAVSLIRPMLTDLSGPGGEQRRTVAAITPRPLILRAGERVEMKVALALGEDAPMGEYRGRLFLLGARSPAIGVLISHDREGA